MTLAVFLICASCGGVAAAVVWFSFDAWRVPQFFFPPGIVCRESRQRAPLIPPH